MKTEKESERERENERGKEKERKRRWLGKIDMTHFSANQHKAHRADLFTKMGD